MQLALWTSCDSSLVTPAKPSIRPHSALSLLILALPAIDCLVCHLQAQQWLQQGMQKLEAHPEHQEAVPLLDELAEMQHTIRNLLQLKEDGNK